MIVFGIKINVPETLFTRRFAPRNLEKKNGQNVTTQSLI